MSSDLAAVHDELRAVARDLLGKTAPRSTGGGAGPPPDRGLLAQSGWLGLEVPEALGGGGATFAEVAVLLGEMGRAATAGAFLGSVVLSVGALNLLEPTPARDELLGQVAAGDAVVAVALATGDGAAGAGGAAAAPFLLSGGAGSLRLSGRAGFVPDAGEAGWLLLLARDEESAPVVVCVPAGGDGPVRVAAQPVVDETRHLAEITAEDVPVDSAWVWRFAGDPEVGARRLLQRGAVAVACDSLGLSEAMLDATVAYAGVRQQFGRPIGSFQAVKHACADMLVQVTVCRQLVIAAVDAVAAAEADASVPASMAKSFAGDTAVAVAGKAMQLHGGIGYTWESGVHLYLKRATLNRSLFGSPMAHRRAIARRYRDGRTITAC